MRIKQWEWFPGGMSAVPAGSYVRHDDHVAEVQGSQAWHYKRGAEDERARIKAAVMHMPNPIDSLDVLAIIDGGQA